MQAHLYYNIVRLVSLYCVDVKVQVSLKICLIELMLFRLIVVLNIVSIFAV